MAELMRLICPNCDAEYEVEAALIPESGRDVQCSNCGHGWFQPSPEAEAIAADDEALFAPLESTEKPGPADPDVPGDDDEPAIDAPPPLAARSIDASVLDVLREEAERESRARQQEAVALEVQGEMGLAPTTSEETALEERIARLKVEAEAHGTEEEVAVGAGHKRQKLPEVDAINSTLRAKTEKRSGESAVIVETLEVYPRKSGGFRVGFIMAMTFVIVAMLAYLFAPLLSQRVPALAEPLTLYSAVIDGLRLSLDGVLRGVVVSISALIGGG